MNVNSNDLLNDIRLQLDIWNKHECTGDCDKCDDEKDCTVLCNIANYIERVYKSGMV